MKFAACTGDQFLCEENVDCLILGMFKQPEHPPVMVVSVLDAHTSVGRSWRDGSGWS